MNDPYFETRDSNDERGVGASIFPNNSSPDEGDNIFTSQDIPQLVEGAVPTLKPEINDLWFESEHEASNEENSNSLNGIGVKLRKFGSFMLYRSAAYVEWAVGIGAGNALVEVGVNRLVATGLVVAGVYKAESIQVSRERRKETPNINVTSSQEENTRFKHIKKAGIEVSAFGSAAWNGAKTTMTHNRAFGIKNTQTRGRAQSLIYGGAVGLWVSPLPFAETARQGAKNGAVEAVRYASENSAQAGLGILATSGGLFLIYEHLEKRRSK